MRYLFFSILFLFSLYINGKSENETLRYKELYNWGFSSNAQSVPRWATFNLSCHLEPNAKMTVCRSREPMPFGCSFQQRILLPDYVLEAEQATFKLSYTATRLKELIVDLMFMDEQSGKLSRYTDSISSDRQTGLWERTLTVPANSLYLAVQIQAAGTKEEKRAALTLKNFDLECNGTSVYSKPIDEKLRKALCLDISGAIPFESSDEIASELLGDGKSIGIGEMMHHNPVINRTAQELIVSLIKQKGIRTVYLETEFSKSLILNSFINNQISLADSVIQHYCSTVPYLAPFILRLREVRRSENIDLELIGVEMVLGNDYKEQIIRDFILLKNQEKRVPEVDSIVSGWDKYHWMDGGWISIFRKHQDKLSQVLSSREIAKIESFFPIDSTQWSLWKMDRRGLKPQADSIRRALNNQFKRDELMFGQIVRMNQLLGNDDRFVFYGHQMHSGITSSKFLDDRSCGSYLNDLYGTNYRRVALAAPEGRMYGTWSYINKDSDRMLSKQDTYSLIDTLAFDVAVGKYLKAEKRSGCFIPQRALPPFFILHESGSPIFFNDVFCSSKEFDGIIVVSENKELSLPKDRLWSLLELIRLDISYLFDYIKDKR